MKNIALLLLAFATTSYAQTDSIAKAFTVSGYLETYYAYDFGQPENNTRPAFAYSFNRHNEVNLNLGFVKLGYARNNVRANLALMTGTYSNANLAAEPGVLKNIFEANAGVKISKNKNVWVDAGVFASHIGFETAIGKDCWNLTRSILADNSPYYESGVKISYTTDDGKWFLSGLVLNGWQRIQRPDGNSTPAFGHQVTWKPTDKIVLNSSSFVGSDAPDTLRKMRYFHNFYGIFQLDPKWAVTAGFDLGAQQKSKGSELYDAWYSPVLIVRYNASSRIAIAARGEYYSDENQVIITTNSANGFKTYGFSANLDYQISDNAIWRIEARGFSSRDAIFFSGSTPSAQNYFLTTSLAISL